MEDMVYTLTIEDVFTHQITHRYRIYFERVEEINTNIKDLVDKVKRLTKHLMFIESKTLKQ